MKKNFLEVLERVQVFGLLVGTAVGLVAAIIIISAEIMNGSPLAICIPSICIIVVILIGTIIFAVKTYNLLYHELKELEENNNDIDNEN